MAQLPTAVVDPVSDAIFAYYKAKYGSELQRPYLGASAIGKPFQPSVMLHSSLWSPFLNYEEK